MATLNDHKNVSSNIIYILLNSPPFSETLAQFVVFVMQILYIGIVTIVSYLEQQMGKKLCNKNVNFREHLAPKNWCYYLN